MSKHITAVMTPWPGVPIIVVVQSVPLRDRLAKKDTVGEKVFARNNAYPPFNAASPGRHEIVELAVLSVGGIVAVGPISE